jgi:hypothetical protein
VRVDVGVLRPLVRRVERSQNEGENRQGLSHAHLREHISGLELQSQRMSGGMSYLVCENAAADFLGRLQSAYKTLVELMFIPCIE